MIPGYINYYSGITAKTYSLNELLGETLMGGCNNQASGKNEIYGGALCALAIMKNNWRIPDDYPVKKW